MGCTALVRALRGSDRRPVVLKVLDPRLCRERDLQSLRREYEVGRSLEAPAVVRPIALEAYEGMLALVLEDFGGEPLDRLLGAPMPMERFLALAVRMAAALAELHQHGLVHRDLKPASILVHPVTAEVKLVDLGIATRLGRDQPPARPPQLIEGSLPYMSPEQTGRMNRAVDGRSDLYSLGVIFHQMLTGSIPFEAHDPLEWIHCHVAREPASAAARVPGVPEVVARIVLRLLAKMADERYQSARGLRHDLERCLSEWRLRGRVDPFPLGERDAVDRLRVPQKLYGRDDERATLLAALERVTSTSEPQLLLVAGASGVGKSSLVRELLRPLVRERGLFLEGKFDPHAENIPYSTFAQAFGELVIDLLVGADEQRASWAGAVREALGGDARLVTDLLPSLKLLVGEPPPPPEVPPTDMERLVRRVLCDFVRVFTRGGRPLVLFIDDLHWADPATLALLAAIVSDPRMRGILVAGAYRPQEVGPSHPLVELVDRSREARASVTEIVLSPLRAEHVLELVAETFQAGRDEARPLAKLVHEWTEGNPLFIVQLLARLEDEGLVRFDERDRAWRWDLARIVQRGRYASVSDLLASRIAALPAVARDLLETAACLGTQAPLSLLAAAHGSAEEEGFRALEEAAAAGVVVRARDSYAFAHDRVQQAVYSLIPRERRGAAHLRAGRNLLRLLPSPRQEEWLFEIVTQLDLGRSLIVDADERIELAELNLRAGRKASGAGAYLSASGYFAKGDELLPGDAWESRHELKYAITLERARCEWLCGHLDAAASMLPELVREARGRMDLAAASLVEVSLHTTRGQFEAASRAALRACSSLFGIDLPLHPTEAALREAAQRTLARLGHRAIEDLLELPAMSDLVLRTAVTLLATALPGAYWTDPNLHDLMCCQIVDFTLRHGTSDGSPHGYVMFGAALGRLFDDWDRAVRLGALACELVERRGVTAAEGSTFFTVAAFVHFWVRHVREVVPVCRRARRAALERGEANIACYAANAIAHCRMRAGDPLAEVAAEVESQLGVVRGAGYREIEAALDSVRRAIHRLQGVSTGEREALAVTPVCRRQLFEVASEAIADLLLGDPVGALRLIRATAALAEAGADRGLPGEAEYCFATALVLAAHLDEEGLASGERAGDLAAVEACRDKLDRWRRHGPANFGGRHALVAAELARLQGRDLDAMQLYEEAISAARENAFVHDEAMSHELAATFHGRRGLHTVADAYLRRARACYLRWGAEGKVRRLEQLHPELAERRQPAPAATFAAGAEQLDLLSAVKASQTISSEIEIEKLVATLLQVALEQGGARRGCLVLERDGGLRVEADASVEEKGIVTRILPTLPMDSLLLPWSVIHQARLTRQPVILEDVIAGAGGFASDAYFSRHRARSVLCLPIIRQAELIGLLYLENRYVAGAFTRDRLAALSLLAAQAAISVENARLLLEERQARQRSSLLAEAGALLSESLDYEATLARLGSLCVKSFATWCMLDLVEGAEIRRLAGACADPAREPVLDQLRRHPARWESPHPATRCLRTGEPLLVPEMSDELVRSHCEDEEHHELVRALGTRSMIVVPLVARGQRLGAFTIVSATPRRYGQADLELAQEVARRAANAMDNARVYREIQRADQRKSEFIAVLSHELRNPLAPIRTGLQLLRRAPPDSPTAAQAREIMERQTEHLTRLVNDLLDVTRISRGAIDLRRTRVDLRDVARSTCEDLRLLLERGALELHLDLPAVPIWIEADETRLVQVLWNLLQNAAKFTPPGGSVTVRVAALEGRAEVSVRDTGAGIAPDLLERLFEPFAQAEQGLARTEGGLGLGLALAKGLVELHGGSIRALSEGPGRGSEFVVRLPLAAAQAGRTPAPDVV